MYVFGDPTDGLEGMAYMPTVFHEDAAAGLFVAAVPNRREYGYFGYLKKMVLTLHNAIKMKQGRLPFHGALLSIQLTGGQEANVLLLGDTGAGKSETIEALRGMAEERIRDLAIVADDMGSLELRDEGVIAFGTETGAFLRLDDLSPGFAFGQIDRAILMSASKTNARIVLPGHRLRHRGPRGEARLRAVREQLRGGRRGAPGAGEVRERGGRPADLRRGHLDEQGNDHLDGSRPFLFREHLRPSPVPGAARQAREPLLFGVLCQRDLRRAAAHPAGHSRARNRRAPGRPPATCST